MSKDFLIRSIKILDIIFITILYFVAGYVVAFSLDVASLKVYGADYNEKSTFALIMEIVSQITLVTVISYMVRNMVQLIPFPLQGMYGFDHFRVHEVSSGGLLTMFTTIFFYDLQTKMYFVRNRVFPVFKSDIKTLI